MPAVAVWHVRSALAAVAFGLPMAAAPLPPPLAVQRAAGCFEALKSCMLVGDVAEGAMYHSATLQLGAPAAAAAAAAAAAQRTRPNTRPARRLLLRTPPRSRNRRPKTATAELWT